MSLSCECDFDDDDYAWHYVVPKDYTTLQTKRRKRCSSCNTLIDVGSTCLQFHRTRRPQNDIEERIYDCDVPLASMFHCESCADMFFNLNALGFTCIAPDENVMQLLKEYREVYGRGLRLVTEIPL